MAEMANEAKGELPLVTFALFAYNQEKHIRRAIEGAFSQAYSPLEIILSDDCSSDRTFEIMQEMAAKYTGPHKVLARKTFKNLGTIDHVIEVFDMANGALVVVAAGDDYSYPERTQEIAKAWRLSGADALFSNHDEIDEEGNHLASNIEPEKSKMLQHYFRGCPSVSRPDGMVSGIPGFSAAYAASVFSGLPRNGFKALNEDALSSFLVNLRGGQIKHVGASLMAYRKGVSSSSMHGGNSSPELIASDERKLQRFSRSGIVFFPYVIDLVGSMDHADLEQFISNMRDAARISAIEASYLDLPLMRRVLMLLRAKSSAEVKYMLPRLMGVYTFSRVKWLCRKIN